MGLLLGNLIGFLILLVAVVVAFFSMQVAVAVFACIAYGVFVIIWALDRLGRLPKEAQLMLMLKQRIIPTDDLVAAYRQYHIFISYPVVGQLMSALLNNLRMVGFIWAILAFWNGYWISGIANAACFLVFGTICVRLDPLLYMRSAADAGQPFARQQLRLITSLLEARDAWLARPVEEDDR